MSSINTEKKITYFVAFTFIIQPILSILTIIIFPPDFSKEYPLYNPDSLMLAGLGNSLAIGGLTVLGIKLADEKKVLPSAGFTMLGISMGLMLVSLFEITQVVSHEAYEKFYRIQASGNFLFLPSMYLISFYEDFKKWIRYIGLVSSLILLVSSLIFLFGNRDFKMLEIISNTGFSFLFITYFAWAYNIYYNYKKNLINNP